MLIRSACMITGTATSRAARRTESRDVSPSEDPISDRALEWLVLLEDDDVTAADRDDFEKWLACDRRHQLAWAEARLIWRAFGFPAFDG